MAFNADEYIEALGPPEITIEGRRYVGRFLSADEWGTNFEGRVSEMAKGNLSNDEIGTLIGDFCNMAFKTTIMDALRGRTVAQKVLRQPPVVLMKIMQDFFDAQARALDVLRALEGDEATGS